MDGWLGKWMDGWMDGWVDGWVDGWMGRWIDGWTDERIRPVGRWMVLYYMHEPAILLRSQIPLWD
jgi:hypothetical protein